MPKKVRPLHEAIVKGFTVAASRFVDGRIGAVIGINAFPARTTLRPVKAGAVLPARRFSPPWSPYFGTFRCGTHRPSIFTRHPSPYSHLASRPDCSDWGQFFDIKRSTVPSAYTRYEITLTLAIKKSTNTITPTTTESAFPQRLTVGSDTCMGCALARTAQTERQ